MKEAVAKAATTIGAATKIATDAAKAAADATKTASMAKAAAVVKTKATKSTECNCYKNGLCEAVHMPSRAAGVRGPRGAVYGGLRHGTLTVQNCYSNMTTGM